MGKGRLALCFILTLLAGGGIYLAGSREKNAEILQSAYSLEDGEIVGTLLADLTHDGKDDLVLISRDTVDEYDLHIYSVIDQKPSLIYEDSISDHHAGWRWYYIYAKEDQIYLMQYIPEIWNGFGGYRLEIFFLDTVKNRKNMLVSDAVMYDPVHKPDSGIEDELARFQRKYEDYQRDSIPLITIGYDNLTDKRYEYTIQ